MMETGDTNFEEEKESVLRVIIAAAVKCLADTGM